MAGPLAGYFGNLLLVGLSVFVAGLWLSAWGEPAREPDAPDADAPETDTEGRAPADAEEGRETGEVKWFNGNKGYGFIVRDSGGEIFIHSRGIRGRRRRLEDGQRVEFRVTEGKKGPQADDVVALS